MPKVLVVEDDSDSANAVIAALRKSGYEVLYASNGQDAVGVIVRDRADVIVLDVRLPVLDGLGFMRVVRAFVRWQNVPVIIVSGMGDDELARVAEFGVSGVFRKATYRLIDLIRAIDKICGMTRR